MERECFSVLAECVYVLRVVARLFFCVYVCMCVCVFLVLFLMVLTLVAISR